MRATSGVAQTAPTRESAVARLEAMLDPTFLEEAGWDAQTLQLTLPADHPLLGRRVCRVPDCAPAALLRRPGGSVRAAGYGWSGRALAWIWRCCRSGIAGRRAGVPLPAASGWVPPRGCASRTGTSSTRP